MSEENENVSTDVPTTEAEDATPQKKRKKWPIVVGVIVVVLVAAGAGFWVWHEQPSFCGAICHTPMDPYLENYDAEPGQASFDKYGNEVSDAKSMMAISHKQHNVNCLGCHEPTMSEQVSEGINWVTGNYEYPLYERTLDDLTEARGATADEFCLNENCHEGITSREDLKKATEDFERNPHEAQHGEVDCGECHKGHRASVNYCSQCHNDADIPDGWLTVAQANKLQKA